MIAKLTIKEIEMEIPDEFEPGKPIVLEGSPSEVAQQVAAGLQGTVMALRRSTGLQAMDPEKIATMPRGGTRNPGSARHSFLIERRDELVESVRRATEFVDDPSWSIWGLTRFRQNRGGEFRPATIEEAIAELELDCSTSTAHRRRRSVDEVIDEYAAKKGWKL